MAKILVIDDEAEWLEFARFALGPLGHEVRSVSDGKEVLSLVKRETFSLVVLDIEMPLSGRILAGYFRTLHPHLPLIVHSAHGAKKYDPDFYHVDEFVVKSASPEKLADAVGRVLDSRRPRD